jgi:hypothetical protein
LQFEQIFQPLVEAGRAESQPILETFACGCASAMTATASSTTTNRIDKTTAFFIVRTNFVMYHAGGTREK